MGNSNVKLALEFAGSAAGAIPPPWGKDIGIAVKVVSGLFSFFGGNGPSTAQLLNQAVSELEAFWTQQNIQTGQASVTAFLQWYQENYQNSASINQPADQNFIQTSLLQILQNQFEPSQVGGGFNQMVNLSGDNYVNPGTWVDPSSDSVLQVLALCVSALTSAYQLELLLQAQIAAFGMPDATAGPSSLANDTLFQEFTASWLAALEQYAIFCNGTGQPAPSGSSQVQVVGITQGWPAAIDFLIHNRTQARLAMVSPVSIGIRHGVDIGPVGSFSDSLTGYYYSTGICESVAQAKEWANAKRGAYIESLNLDSAFSQYSALAPNWKTAAANFLATSPPSQPSQSGISISSWGPQAGQGSPWLGVEYVRYGVSFLSPTTGPSLRSDWSGTWIATNGLSQPTITGLPLISAETGAAGATRQIWRQFRVSGDKNPDPLGTPMIVYSDNGTSSTWEDNTTLSAS